VATVGEVRAELERLAEHTRGLGQTVRRCHSDLEEAAQRVNAVSVGTENLNLVEAIARFRDADRMLTDAADMFDEAADELSGYQASL